MGVRRHVLVLIGIGFALAVALIALMAAALSTSDHTPRRIAAISDRLAVLNELSASIGSYGEQAAETLLLGRGRAEDLATARINIERELARLTQTTRTEITTLGGMDEVADALPDIEGARRLIELYHAIDGAMNTVLSMRGNDPGLDSKEAYQTTVAFRLTNELQPVLSAAVAGESSKLADEIGRAETNRIYFLVAAAAIGVLGLSAIIGFGVRLWQTIVVPLDQLSARARAIAAGEPDAPATRAMGDFESLSHSLTAVATATAEQRRNFAAATEKLAAETEARTAQLRSANEQLREIDHRRGQFLADVSHELRTPLTILRGEADVALRGTGDAATLRESLERIQGQASELGQLLEDLLEFARSTAEDQPFVAVDTSLDEVVAAAAQEARMLASPREVAVTVASNTGGRHIEADFRRLKQALIIGIDNAIKHSPPGTTVTVETAGQEQSVRISIADEGPGVDEADLPRVFERFFRGKDQADGLSSGLGIGLAIAKDIVERHGGTIALRNRAEGGAMLSIVLPTGERAA
jgi:signal transduction histidine kinase